MCIALVQAVEHSMLAEGSAEATFANLATLVVQNVADVINATTATILNALVAKIKMDPKSEMITQDNAQLQVLEEQRNVLQQQASSLVDKCNGAVKDVASISQQLNDFLKTALHTLEALTNLLSSPL